MDETAGRDDLTRGLDETVKPEECVRRLDETVGRDDLARGLDETVKSEVRETVGRGAWTTPSHGMMCARSIWPQAGHKWRDLVS